MPSENFDSVEDLVPSVNVGDLPDDLNAELSKVFGDASSPAPTKVFGDNSVSAPAENDELPFTFE